MASAPRDRQREQQAGASRIDVDGVFTAVMEPVERRLLMANVLPGFTDALVGGGMTRPVAMEFAPDGRIFVTEQPGRVRIIKDGQTLATPFVSLDVSSTG